MSAGKVAVWVTQAGRSEKVLAVDVQEGEYNLNLRVHIGRPPEVEVQLIRMPGLFTRLRKWLQEV